MVNKRGQTLGVSIISAIFIFIIGMMCINFLMDEIVTFRVNMNCESASSISDSTKLLCLATDATIPYWILLVFSVLVGGITARLAI
jgi:hypothetical protein